MCILRPQVRGSIPLLWSQIPNVKYKPPTRMSLSSAYEPAFDKHIEDLLAAYQVGLVTGSASALPCMLRNESAPVTPNV